MSAIPSELPVKQEPIVTDSIVRCTHPSAILISVVKSASTFLADHFAPAMAREIEGMAHVDMAHAYYAGTPLTAIAIPPTGMVASRVYPFLYDLIVEQPIPQRGRFADKKLLMLRRDPRDVTVSLYYSLRFSHTPLTVPEHHVVRRRNLNSQDLLTGLRDTAKTAMRQFRASSKFLEQYPQTCLTTYEQLVDDFAAWSNRVTQYMEWPDILARQVFQGLDAEVRPPDHENPFAHKRRVRPGNWREVFDRGLCDLFQEEIGEPLAAAGYGW